MSLTSYKPLIRSLTTPQFLLTLMKAMTAPSSWVESVSSLVSLKFGDGSVTQLNLLELLLINLTMSRTSQHLFHTNKVTDSTPNPNNPNLVLLQKYDMSSKWKPLEDLHPYGNSISVYKESKTAVNIHREGKVEPIFFHRLSIIWLSIRVDLDIALQWGMN